MTPSPDPAPAAKPHAHRFHLTRHFAITSLVGILMATASLIWVYRELTLQQLVQHEGRANVDMTQAFANTVWRQYRSFVVQDGRRGRDALLADPMLPRLREDLRQMMRGIVIAKIKIYGPDGTTVFSTDEKQIGENKADNPGFRSALGGEPVSQITHREDFDSFEGKISDRDLISSYIPVRASPGGPVEAVFEVYSDVTELVHRQAQAQWQVAAVVLAALAALYVFLSFVVRRADAIIGEQERERQAHEARMRHQAYHDTLTGLPNRAYFVERLGETVAAAARSDKACALMFVDLDRFKIVNDSLGHDAGDQLLQAAAVRIKASLRETELLFRMGGDEFTVILPRIAGPQEPAAVARRLIEEVSRPFAVLDHQIVVGATVGIAVFPADGEDADTLLRNADAAMYSAKAAGRGTYAFYQASMNQRARQRLDLEQALHRGFRSGEFELLYQPRVDAHSRRLVAVETLLFWNRPSMRPMTADEFVPILEDIGMMGLVGEWMLRSACLQLRKWQEGALAGARPGGLRVSLNVAAAQLGQPSFVATVGRVLRDTGLEPSQLELEFTEDLFGHAGVAREDVLAALKALGVRIAIDDVGTTCTALNPLRRVAVDALKLDGQVLDGPTANERDRAVVAAIGQIARTLGITLVAQGVHSEAQARHMADIGCAELQGPLVARPLDAAKVQALLARTRADSATALG